MKENKQSGIEYDIYLDESGNQGRGEGKYFTIAFVSGQKNIVHKSIRNMKRASLKIKKAHPEKFSIHSEVKAANVNLETRKYVLKKISMTEIFIDYIVVDKSNLKDSMFEHKNISYNFYCKFVLKRIFERFNPKTNDVIYIHADNRSTKVKSGNSFTEFMYEFLTLQNGWDCVIKTDYLESSSSYGIQCADFVSNAINFYYNKNDECLFEIINPRVDIQEKFPYRKFS